MASIDDRQRCELCFPLWSKLLTIAAFCVAVVSVLFEGGGLRVGVDVNVYRLGAQRLLDGLPLYDGGFHIFGDIFLPFTYPPAAAIAFTPLTLFGPVSATVVVALLNLAVLYAIVWVVLRRVGRLDRENSAWAAAGATAVLSFFGPVLSTLHYGQVNLLLATLVLLDVFVLPPRFRGVLIGVATAVKLTPAVFGLWLLLRKDWASIARMGAAALGVTLTTHLVIPRESSTYWLDTLSDTGRIGGLGYASNQSINGELWRLGLRGDSDGSLLWLVLVLAALAATVALMLRLFKAGAPGLALGANALFGLLASPVSWMHHYVWVVIYLFIGCVVLWRVRQDRRGQSTEGAGVTADSSGDASLFARRWPGFAWLIATGVVCIVLEPTAVAPTGHNAEMTWSLVWHLVGNAYLWWTLVAYPALWFLAKPAASATTAGR